MGEHVGRCRLCRAMTATGTWIAAPHKQAKFLFGCYQHNSRPSCACNATCLVSSVPWRSGQRKWAVLPVIRIVPGSRGAKSARE